MEQAHPEAHTGVKGIGEPGLAPTAAAIVNAVCHACDADFTSIPIKPEHVLFRRSAAMLPKFELYMPDTLEEACRLKAEAPR